MSGSGRASGARGGRDRAPRLSSGVRRLAAAALLLLLAGCFFRHGSDAPGVHTLSGHVVLVGYLVNPDASFAGTRVVGDADGVPIELLYGPQVIARTTTRAGTYAFPNLAQGGYVARVRVTPALHDETVPLIVADTDVESADTLRLASFGELTPTPNPVTTETFVYFTLADTQRVDLAILSLKGDTVKVLLRGRRPPGLNQVRWDGTDRAGVLSSAPLVWVAFSPQPDAVHPPRPFDDRIHLLIHQPALLP